MPKKLQTPNPALPFVELELSGTTYKLCLDYGALATAEYRFHRAGKTDINLLEAWPGLSSTMNVMFLFAASLSTYHPELEWEDALALFGPATHTPILVAVLEARGISVPVETDQAPPEPETEPGAQSSGSDSLATPA